MILKHNLRGVDNEIQSGRAYTYNHFEIKLVEASSGIKGTVSATSATSGQQYVGRIEAGSPWDHMRTQHDASTMTCRDTNLNKNPYESLGQQNVPPTTLPETPPPVLDPEALVTRRRKL